MNLAIVLVLLPALVTITLSAPVERVDALPKQPVNFTFTPIDSMEGLAHVEYGAPIHLQTSDFRFSATLSKRIHDDETANLGLPEGGAQAVIRSHDIRGAPRAIISICDSLMRAFQERGMSQDTISQYVSRNVHVADPATGDQYQLVPDNDPEKLLSIDYDTATITLKAN